MVRRKTEQTEYLQPTSISIWVDKPDGYEIMFGVEITPVGDG
jgi:hypothetical protein